MNLYGAKRFLTVITLLMLSALVTAAFFAANNLPEFFLASLVPGPNISQSRESPQIVKAVYITGWSAGNSSYLNYLANLFKTSQINSVVVDVKDASGYVYYNANVLEVQKYKLYNGSIKNIDNLMKFFHDQNIYVIARIVVFQDPMLAKNRPDIAVYDTNKTFVPSNPILWQDNKGLSWMDPASKEVWDYNIALAKEAASRGFDEINFDYIRFPSDGDLSNMGFPAWNKNESRRDVLKNFYKYAREKLQGITISADLFGLATVNNDDLGIGQYLEDALPYFDYVCPMVYPSHYATNFLGFKNPAEHPYEVVKHCSEISYYRRQIFITKQKITQEQEKRLNPESSPVTQVFAAKIRPWLQDFNLGAVYTADMVKSQITAVKESYKEDYAGFMLWNPSNYYTKEAIAK